MTLGNTIDEKRMSYELLTQNAKKWGRVFGIVTGSAAAVGLFVISGNTESLILAILIGLAVVVLAPSFYYLYGQVLYYGYLVIKLWFVKNDLDAADVAVAAGTSVAISYIIGGKKAAKTTGIIWLIIIGIAVTVGVYAGLYYYIKFYREAKKLGFAQPLVMDFGIIGFLKKRLVGNK